MRRMLVILIATAASLYLALCIALFVKHRFKPGTATYQVLPAVDHNSISASPAYVPALAALR